MIKLLEKLKGYIVTAVAAAAFLAWGYWQAKVAGKRSAEAKQSKARDKLQEHYDEIDRSNIDPADSYKRLRRMSD